MILRVIVNDIRLGAKVYTETLQEETPNPTKNNTCCGYSL